MWRFSSVTWISERKPNQAGSLLKELPPCILKACEILIFGFWIVANSKTVLDKRPYVKEIEIYIIVSYL